MEELVVLVTVWGGGCVISNQIKSNQIKSNQIKSNQIKTSLFTHTNKFIVYNYKCKVVKSMSKVYTLENYEFIIL